MKKKFFIIYILLVFISCSSIFKGSITGSIHDLDDYNNQNITNSGISNVTVFLYLDEKKRDYDYNQWLEFGRDPYNVKSKNGKDVTNFILDTVSNNSGDFEISGILWESLFPEYGDTGDLREIFLLFLHNDYGLVKNPVPINITSGNTRKLPPIKIKKNLNEVLVRGRVLDYDKKSANGGDLVPIENAEVEFFLPSEWLIDGEDVIVKDSDWNNYASYRVLTDSEGSFQQKVSFKSFIPMVGPIDRIKILLTVSKEGYSSFCLSEEANAKFTGFNSDGSVFDGDRSQDISLENSIWVLLDGEETTVSYYDIGEEKEVTDTIGGGDFRKDLDIDKDGFMNIYLPCVLVADDDNNIGIKLLNDIHLRDIEHSSILSGIVGIENAVSTFVGKNNMTVQFFSSQEAYNNKEPIHYSVMTTYTPYSGNVNNLGEEGFYSRECSWRSYNYSGERSSFLWWVYAFGTIGSDDLSSRDEDSKVKLISGLNESKNIVIE